MEKTAIIDLKGAMCTSCRIGIVHMARRLEGIKDVEINIRKSLLSVVYEGTDEVLENICSFVKRIGYEAEIREEIS